MALNQTLTPDLIHETADQLQNEGIKPTLAVIRERLGGGSFTTISEAMKSWKQEQQATAQLQKIVIPDELNNRLSLLGAELWETAQNFANEQLAKDKETLAHKEALLTGEVEEYKKVVSTLEAEQNDLTNQLDQLNAQLDTATSSNAEYVKTIDDLNKNNIEQGNKLQSLNDKLTVERDKSAQLENKLDQLTAHNETLTADLATANANLSHANADISRLTAIMDNQKTEYDNQLVMLTDKLDSMTAQNTALSNDNAKLNGKLEVLTDQLNKASQKEADLQAKIDVFLQTLSEQKTDKKA